MIFKFTADGLGRVFGNVPGEGFGLAFDGANNMFAATARVELSTNSLLEVDAACSSENQLSPDSQARLD